MAELTEVIVHRGGAVGYGLKYLDLEAESANTNDTIIISEFTTIKDTTGHRSDTGAEISCTESGSTITIAEAGLTNVPVAIKVFGY